MGWFARLRIGALLLATWSALPVGGSIAGQDLSRNGILEVQFRLDQLGFAAGEPDGRAGQRTLAALDAFAQKQGTKAALDPETLERLREAAKGIEGWSRDGGRVDLLVFTDEGTAQILKVTNWGRIHKSNSETYLIGYDRDGRQLIGEHFGVSEIEHTTDIALGSWVSFGYEMYFPTPPKGERLNVQQSITRPVIKADGSVAMETSVYDNAFLTKPASSPWVWYTGTEQDADPRLEGAWTMTLGQKGVVLMSRTFNVRHQ